MDPGQHYIGAVVSKEFLEFSKSKGECGLEGADPRQRPHDARWTVSRAQGRLQMVSLCQPVGWEGDHPDCRWKEAFMASASMGEGVVPKWVDS